MESEFLDALHRDLGAGEGSGARLVQACRDATDVTGAGIGTRRVLVHPRETTAPASCSRLGASAGPLGTRGEPA